MIVLFIISQNKVQFSSVRFHFLVLKAIVSRWSSESTRTASSFLFSEFWWCDVVCRRYAVRSTSPFATIISPSHCCIFHRNPVDTCFHNTFFTIFLLKIISTSNLNSFCFCLRFSLLNKKSLMCRL